MPVIDERHSAQSNCASTHNNHTLKEYVQFIGLCRATPEEWITMEKKYPRANLKVLFEKYKKKFVSFDIDKFLEKC